MINHLATDVSDGVQTDEIVARLLDHVKEPAY